MEAFIAQVSRASPATIERAKRAYSPRSTVALPLRHPEVNGLEIACGDRAP